MVRVQAHLHESRLEVVDSTTTDADAFELKPGSLLLVPGRGKTAILAYNPMPRRIISASQYVGDVACRHGELVADRAVGRQLS